jgi:site-specific DNA-methyltransferase (adenine-specific)
MENHDKTGNPSFLLYQGDCLEIMRHIPDQSVDMILCDLPYGTTDCKWDKIVPLEPLWEQYHRVTKENSAIVLFSSQPFTNKLIDHNPKYFRYEWIWVKNKKSGFMNAHYRPIKSHENLLVFYRKQPVYNPQMTKATKNHGVSRQNQYKTKFINIRGQKAKDYVWVDNGERFPTTVLDFKCVPNHKGMHSTEKPVALCEYLIKTYTNPGQTVLDNCMGSGTTGVAALNTGRFFIGIELDPHYFEMAKERIGETAMMQNDATQNHAGNMWEDT